MTDFFFPNVDPTVFNLEIYEKSAEISLKYIPIFVGTRNNYCSSNYQITELNKITKIA